MHLKVSLLSQIFSIPSPHIQQHRGEVRFTLVCTTEEGVACRFAAGAWNDPALEPVAEPLVSQIGWKLIEHAPLRQVVVRCTTLVEAPERAQCSIDLGSGFEPLPVRADDEA
jgi:hypothetical protein